MLFVIPRRIGVDNVDATRTAVEPAAILMTIHEITMGRHLSITRLGKNVGQMITSILTKVAGIKTTRFAKVSGFCKPVICAILRIISRRGTRYTSVDIVITAASVVARFCASLAVREDASRTA
jgi:hypothetical protein